jgi:exodeoxyribonuclease-3
MSMLKIATWNVNSLRVRLNHLLQWLDTEQPDVMALQEIKLTDDNFPNAEIENAGYIATFAGQKTYNGVAILSKQPVIDIIRTIPDYADEQRRVLALTTGDITVLNLYVPNGSEIGSDKYFYKLEWFARLHPFVRQLLDKNNHVVVLGDFNIAPTDRDTHDPQEWEGKVLVSPAERAEFDRLIGHGLTDCFRLFDQAEMSFSWWDYRAAAFRRNRGMRIDHILANQTLAEKCVKCYIDKTPRGLERPSDHTPVVAEFDL